MVFRGQQIYGQTLRLMQNALYDPRLMQDDNTLAAARCMVLYESFESTSEDMAAWQNHIHGIARMIEMRGPHRHRDPLSKSILESMRYNMMIVCLMRRESSFLGSQDWLTTPWVDTTKDLDQRLYDYGFALSNMMQSSEEMSRIMAPQQLPRMLEQIYTGYTGLVSLNDELLAMQTQHSQFTGAAAHEIRFGETTFAITSALIIALDLTSSLFAAALVQKCGDNIPGALQNLVGQIRRYIDPTRRRELAKKVLRQLEFCLQTQFEYMRPKVIYPLNVVRWELRNDPEAKVQIQALFEAIAAKDQFRIARGVQRAGRSTLPSVVAESASPLRGS